jgi:hypothetical protein
VEIAGISDKPPKNWPVDNTVKTDILGFRDYFFIFNVSDNQACEKNWGKKNWQESVNISRNFRQ